MSLNPTVGLPDVDALPLCSRSIWRIPIAAADNPAVSVHAIALVGERRRPCLAVVAGVHGDEYDGILAAQAIGREIDPASLDGAILVVPVANPHAFAARQRRTPADDADINRVFPGRLDGSPSEVLAYLLCHRILNQTDLIFTLHGATSTGLLTSWVEYIDRPDRVGKASRAMAYASGIPDLIALGPLPGRLLTAMADLGVPLIEGEVGGRGRTSPDNVRYYADRALDVARYAGILKPALAAVAEAPVRRVWGLGSIESNCMGIFLRDAQLDQSVHAGDRLGIIVDDVGRAIGEVRAPADGTIGGYRDHAGVDVGDSLFTLWLPREATS